MIQQHQFWKFRDDEISMKEFYKLSSTDREEYLLIVIGLKPEERSSMDIILLNKYKIKPDIKNFLEL
jgi:hypothetical protein